MGESDTFFYISFSIRFGWPMLKKVPDLSHLVSVWPNLQPNLAYMLFTDTIVILASSKLTPKDAFIRQFEFFTFYLAQLTYNDPSIFKKKKLFYLVLIEANLDLNKGKPSFLHVSQEQLLNLTNKFFIIIISIVWNLWVFQLHFYWIFFLWSWSPLLFKLTNM